MKSLEPRLVNLWDEALCVYGVIPSNWYIYEGHLKNVVIDLSKYRLLAEGTTIAFPQDVEWLCFRTWKEDSGNIIAWGSTSASRVEKTAGVYREALKC